MDNSQINRIVEFRQKLRDLMLEYDVTLEINTGYYGDIEGVDFCIGDKRAVNYASYGDWDFDGNGHRSLEQIREDMRK